MVDRVSSPLPAALEDRVVGAGGVMGTMLRPVALTPGDFAGHEGCDGARSDVVRGVHPAAGADAVETNSLGAILPNLADHGIPDRIFERPGVSGESAAEPGRPRFLPWLVRGGTEPVTPGHARLRDASVTPVKGLFAGGVDGKAPQGLLRTKASIVGSKRAVAADGRIVPITTRTTVETTCPTPRDSTTGAAPTAPEPPGIDLIGLICATDPAEKGERPRQVPAAAHDLCQTSRAPRPERRALSEELQPNLNASIAHHPEAKYLNV